MTHSTHTRSCRTLNSPQVPCKSQEEREGSTDSTERERDRDSRLRGIDEWLLTANGRTLTKSGILRHRVAFIKKKKKKSDLEIEES